MQIDKDYYEILGIPQTATDEDIRQAYRSLARRAHPDVSEDAVDGEVFQDAQEAYEILSDPAQRQKYDQWREQQGHDRPGLPFP